MSKKIFTAALIFALFLTGCAAEPRVNMFVGELAEEQVATLLPLPPDFGAVNIRIDGEAPGSCLTNCAFFRPVRVLPGVRKLKIELFLPPLKGNKRIVPANRIAQVRATEINLVSILVNSAILESEFTFEQGKRYRLEFAYRSADDRVPYIWWELVP